MSRCLQVFVALCVVPHTVFSEEPDEAASAKALMAKLGSKSFKAREDATNALRRRITNPELYRVLAKELPDQRDPEIQRRGKILLDERYQALLGKCQIDLRGEKEWPCLQVLSPYYELGGPWKGMKRWEIVAKYQGIADHLKGVRPKFTLRGFLFVPNVEATKIFFGERIEFLLKESIRDAKNESDLHQRLKDGMAAIQKDMDLLIQEAKKAVSMDPP